MIVITEFDCTLNKETNNVMFYGLEKLHFKMMNVKLRL